MFGILQRYLASHYILPFSVSLVFFVVFLLTFQLFRIIRLVIGKGIAFFEVTELIGHIAVTFLPFAVPLSALFATVYALNKLSEDSEIVAMRSFGTSKFKLFFPFLILGIFVSVALFTLNRTVIPNSKMIFKNTVIKLTSRGMFGEIKPGQFFTEIPNVTMFAETVYDNGKTLKNVFIHLKGRSGTVDQVIVAKQGVLIKQEDDDGGSPNIRLHLKDGNITKVFTDKRDLEKILFQDYDFPVFNSSTRPGFITKDSMRSSRELTREIKERKESIAKYEAMNPISNDDKNIYNGIVRNLPRSLLEYWSRINTPIQCLLFIFLGFSLGIKKGRGRSRNTTGVALFALIVYYVLFFVGVSFAKKGQMPASVAVFLPSFIILLISSRFYYKLDWQG